MPAQILIVDSDGPVVECVAHVLRQHGHDVRTAPDGVQALDELVHDPADLILTDVTLPTVKGKTLLQELRDQGDETPMVLVTAVPYSGSDFAAVSFLRKPFEITHLLAAVGHALVPDSSARPPEDCVQSSPLVSGA